MAAERKEGRKFFGCCKDNPKMDDFSGDSAAALQTLTVSSDIK